MFSDLLSQTNSTHVLTSMDHNHADASEPSLCRRKLQFEANSQNAYTIPHVGMEFKTEEDSYKFYLSYSKRIGFGIRRSSKHNDDSGCTLDRIFCCSAQGRRGKDKRDVYVKCSRPQTRFDCEAKLKIKRNTKNGLFEVVEFHSDHSHALASPTVAHLHRCHRNISSSAGFQIEMASDVGISPKQSHSLMSKQVGGRDLLGFIPEDYKNYLRTKRTRECIIGDTGGVLEYLQKMQSDDPNFYHAIQLDCDELITNIFWSDARMRADYGYFGDVVCFDTTYRKNNEGRPIALFVGVNHHRQNILFGAALLYDETAFTFEWLFETFSRGMFGKKPTTILTDQDAAMAKALASKWPETNHRLCIWHIYQNAAIHLSGVFEEFKEFAKDFASCIYDFDEEADFVEAWNRMMCKYSLEGNQWLNRMFGIRQKWALAYGRFMFCADLTTTQRSESMNSLLKRYVSYKHKFLEFFKHFNRLIEDRRYEELKADFKSTISVPTLSYPIQILKDAGNIYTLEVFKLFEGEWFLSHDCESDILEDADTHVKYKIHPPNRIYHHVVTADKNSSKIECTCRKIDFSGIVCSHILKIFTMTNIKKIPPELIMTRWTRNARNGYVGLTGTSANGNVNAKELQNIRYRELCAVSMPLFTKASQKEHTFKELIEVLMSQYKTVDANVIEPPIVVASGELLAKGIKSKKRTQSGKRLKSGIEKNSIKKRGRGKKKHACKVQIEASHSMSTAAGYTPEHWKEDSRMIYAETPFIELLSQGF